jgi:hypothetical protein
MSISLKLSELEFGSLLSYSPAGSSEPERRSKSIMTAIKNDKFIGDPPILTSEFISNSIKEKMTTLPFGYFFRTNPVLVPIPNSSLMRPNTLWVSRRLAGALYRNGLGISAENLLERFRPLRKAATCTAQNRPKVSEHYNSLNIQKGFHKSTGDPFDRRYSYPWCNSPRSGKQVERDFSNGPCQGFCGDTIY